MPRIEFETKLDFKDVLIRPKRSTLKSRSEVDLERTFIFRNSKREWTGEAGQGQVEGHAGLSDTLLAALSSGCGERGLQSSRGGEEWRQECKGLLSAAAAAVQCQVGSSRGHDTAELSQVKELSGGILQDVLKQAAGSGRTLLHSDAPLRHCRVAEGAALIRRGCGGDGMLLLCGDQLLLSGSGCRPLALIHHLCLLAAHLFIFPSLTCSPFPSPSPPFPLCRRAHHGRQHGHHRHL